MKWTASWIPTNYNSRYHHIAVGSSPASMSCAENKSSTISCVSDIKKLSKQYRNISKSSKRMQAKKKNLRTFLYFPQLNHFQAKNISYHVNLSAQIPTKMSTKHYQWSALCLDDPCVPWLLAPTVTWPVGPAFMCPPWLLWPQWQGRN